MTILVVVVTMNAVNFIDGLDGLAAGIVGIGGLAFFAYYFTLVHRLGLLDQSEPALVSVCSPGCASGSCRTTSIRRASSWGTPARCSSG